jgi:hypothetical protein
MAAVSDVIREYNEAEYAYRKALATAGSRDELVALPADVRASRAGLEAEPEAKRFLEAKIAYEKMQRDREERWIAAHEDMYNLRRGSVAS